MIGNKKARCQGIYPYFRCIVLSDMYRQPLGKVAHPSLSCRVSGNTCEWTESVHRRNIQDDTLPLKMTVPAMVGPRAGKTPTPHDTILDDYYELRGWDRNGIPTRERLEALGLGRFAAFLP